MFKPQCAKCGSFNIDLEEDPRAFSGGGRHQVQLHCYTCGMVIYGEDKIQAEIDRQYAEFEELRRSRPGGAAPEPEPAPPTAAPTPASPAAQASEANAAEAAAPSANAADNIVVTDQTAGLRPCAWRECAKMARPNSKYCSRNCSNKNARARHAKRRKPEDGDAATG